MEWGEFAPRYFSPPPTRRTGKRWIREGEIPGKVIDGRPYVDLPAFLGQRTEIHDDELAGLLR